MATAADSTDTREVPERRRDRPRRNKRPKPPVPATEAEIDAPDRLTLSMLGVMAVVTIALWLFARMACNYHPPRETRRPRAVKTEEFARDPKGAAVEMQQRLLQLNFAGALELAKGDAVADIEKARAACATNAQDCAMKRKQLEKSVETFAAVLERTPTTATVRVTSIIPGGKQATIEKLEREGGLWKVVSRVPDDGSFKPTPPLALTATPAVSASGAPAGSASAVPGAASAQNPALRLAPRPAAPVPPPAPAPAASP